MTAPIPAHGGTLVDRVLRGDARQSALNRLASAPRVTLDDRVLSDLELIATGAYSPLTGFLGEHDYRRVIADMRLADGTLWPIPMVLGVDAATAATLRDGEPVALQDASGHTLALLELRERYPATPQEEAAQVYGTTDTAHPGVAWLLQRGPVLLAGDIWLVGELPMPFPRLHHTPQETRAIFAARGWRTIVGFQTRNPIHRAHEYMQKTALELVDGLLLHPLVGATKGDDVPADVRVRSYDVLVQGYYPADRVLLAAYPAAMRYAGPREAVLHAISRQNYGCTHFIVGRDHAGVGNYYGTYDAQRLFTTLQPGDLAIATLPFEHTFYCNTCGSIASSRTCPHDASHHLVLSGTRVRELLRAGTPPPPEFTRPEVAELLIDGMQYAEIA